MTDPFALIIEDNSDLAHIFSRALQGAGFITEIVPDGRAAQERLLAARPAVVLLDLHLPYISGKEILKQIQTTPALSKAKIIITTADPAMAATLQNEADLILIKPISIKQLRILAARMLLSIHE